MIALAVILAASFLTASTAAVFRPGPWYASLAKPSWVPPNWLFPPAWALMYALMSAAAFLVWLFAAPGEGTTALTVYGIQLVLNALWSPIFFGLRRMGWAFVAVMALWLAVLATTLLFFQVNYWAGLMFLPYLLWVTFASFLNLTMWRLNRRGAGATAGA
nr:TspO/MBR family protein [Roseospira goensis]